MHRALLMSLVLCACRTITPAAPPPTSVWEVPISFDAHGLPLVEATIGGKQTLLVLDTGAPQTTLQAWFVESLEVEQTEAGGHRVAELPLQLGTHVTPMRWKRVETVPGDRERGIGGTLSPHRAITAGAVAIDFPNKRLLALDGKANAWLRWLDERSPMGQVEALPRVAPFGLGLHVKSRVGDGKEVATSLASAQERTAYAAGLFDPALLVGGPQIAGLHVRVGDSEFGPLEVRVRPDPAQVAQVEGWLGMDVLQRLVLLVPVHELHPIWLMTPR